MVFTVMVWVMVLVLLVSLVGVRGRVDGWNSSAKQRAWWQDTAAPVEGFQSLGVREEQKEDDLEHIRVGAAPASLDRRHPYHLLGDVLPSETARASGVTSRSCWATDAEAQLSKVGSYRQLTNNWRREYPDSCSMGRQEMVLGFYEPRAL
jgi:hypothetical protein